MRTGPKGLIGLGLPAALRPHAPDKGVPAYLSINGLRCVLLVGADNQPLRGADGQYLYGVA